MIDDRLKRLTQVGEQLTVIARIFKEEGFEEPCQLVLLARDFVWDVIDKSEGARFPFSQGD